MTNRRSRPGRSLDGRPLRCALIALGLMASASPATAKETPKDRYDFDIACLAISGAALSLPAPYAKQRTDAATMHQFYAKRLTASAAAVRIPDVKARAEAEDDRQGFVATLSSADGRAELVKHLEHCEALPVFEVIDRVKQ